MTVGTLLFEFCVSLQKLLYSCYLHSTNYVAEFRFVVSASTLQTGTLQY